jgi:ATP-dependent Clp protease ATP-binding subunit ClpC
VTKTFRVHFVTHHDGRKTGWLLRRWDVFFDRPAPSAYGATEAEVLASLERNLAAAIATEHDVVDRYLWSEPFQTRVVSVVIHPLSTIAKRPVIGKEPITLRVAYSYTSITNEPRPGDRDREQARAHRVILPRLGLWLVLEDLETAPEVLRIFLGTALLGESPTLLYDLRSEGEEYVREWEPELLARLPDRVTSPEVSATPPELSRVADDWVFLDRRGKLPKTVGDPPELAALVEAARQVPPPSLLLVGPAGAGKSALVRRLASNLVEIARTRRSAADVAREPPRLWATSADRILAGMVYLGMWQERVLTLVSELSGRGEWLYVDRLAALARPQHDGTSIAELLEPSIGERDVSLIAEVTPSELEHLKRRASSLVGRFRIVHVRPRGIDETIALLGPYAARKPGLDLHPTAIARLVRHVDGITRDQVLPGAAFRFVDWLEGASTDRKTYYPRDVSAAFSTYTGIPVELVADEYAQSAEDLAAKLRARVIGQDDACAACGRLLARFKSGMNDPERPSGTLLLVGPTGVGKTELAKGLARTLFGDDARLIRVDMSEYALRGSAQRLLESGEGATSLVQKVRTRPLSVVLFDEIEKAHPEVFDLLLGILGEGRASDDEGRFVDFRGTFLVMTSNLGVRDRPAVGFGGSDDGDFERAVRRQFRPELFNRIDLVLPFRSLSKGDILAILDLLLVEVSARAGLARRGITLEVDAAARARLAELGHDPLRGARPLKRAIEERVVAPIAAVLAADPSARDRRLVIQGPELAVVET